MSFLTFGLFFYSLEGSGSGYPVFAAGLLHPFESCCGIEILSSLHDLSIQGKSTWDSLYQAKYNSKMEFYHGSITDLTLKDWTDGDVVLANSTCFDDSLMQEIDTIAIRLRAGAYIITLSKRLTDVYFDLIEEVRLAMSW